MKRNLQYQHVQLEPGLQTRKKTYSKTHYQFYSSIELTLHIKAMQVYVCVCVCVYLLCILVGTLVVMVNLYLLLSLFSLPLALSSLKFLSLPQSFSGHTLAGSLSCHLFRPRSWFRSLVLESQCLSRDRDRSLFSLRPSLYSSFLTTDKLMGFRKGRSRPPNLSCPDSFFPPRPPPSRRGIHPLRVLSSS